MVNKLRQHAIRLPGRLLSWTLIGAITILLVRALDARSLPDLEVWHRAVLDAEFTRHMAGTPLSLADYLEIETKLFDELEQRLTASSVSAAGGRLNRYFPGSRSNPRGLEQNWNRTFEIRPAEIRGGALLIHGLTDSPYSVRRVADAMAAQGYYVLAMRMPGHGTIPGALLIAHWQDWVAAVSIGARHVAAQIPAESPFLLGGYSNGGALVLNHTVDALLDDENRVPDQLILISPMLGVSPAAVFANWHKSLSWMGPFEKFKWIDVYPEYDPFKYNSFPKEAGHQSYLLINDVVDKLEAVEQSGRMNELPPILTFQSLVDATVSTKAIVDRLFNRLQTANNELVLFDINHISVIADFVNPEYNRSGLLSGLRERATLPYALTVVTNTAEDVSDVLAETRAAGATATTETTLGLRWPEQVYSLSHVALPFAADDPLYGVIRQDGTPAGANIGTIQPRGEKNVLNVPSSLFLRLRYNPFYPYLERRVVETVSRHAAAVER